MTTSHQAGCYSRTRADGYEVSDDRSRIDLDVVHSYLRTAYWSPGVPRETVRRSLEGSLALGLYGPDGAQVGLGRAVTDRATFAWIADVFVTVDHRGQGLGRFVIESMLDHPDLQGLRRIMLATADAHDLYRSYGFDHPTEPDRLLVIQRPARTLYGGDPA